MGCGQRKAWPILQDIRSLRKTLFTHWTPDTQTAGATAASAAGVSR